MLGHRGPPVARDTLQLARPRRAAASFNVCSTDARIGYPRLVPILDDAFISRLERTHATDRNAADYADAEVMLARFQQRFPAERLRRLSGTALLDELHGRESLDCLAYWLEFYDKPDFRTRLFGSIRGGSALKFGIYQRNDDNAWYEHAGEAGKQRKLLPSEAVAIAEKQRDQILRAYEVAARLPADPAKGGYATLQEDIAAAAPDLVSLAFLHKFLSLHFPDRLDDFHQYAFHAHHLLLMGQEPRARGLYTCTGTLIAAWHELRPRLDVRPVVFSHLLNVINGAPFHWWRVGTTTREGQSLWPEMKDAGDVAVGWHKLGDLGAITAGLTGNEAKEAIRAALAKHYPDDSPQTRGRFVNQLWAFFTRMAEGDHVLAADGQTILGIGRITGPYVYTSGKRFPHSRAVEWRSTTSFKAPDHTGFQTTVYPLDGHWPPLLAAVRHLAQAAETRPRPPAGSGVVEPSAPLPPVPAMIAIIDDELRRKGQIVLYGPPGTGKTWHARRAAEELSARAVLGRTWLDLTDDERKGLLGLGRPEAQRIWTCTFHPSYGYEQFVEGLRPESRHDGQLAFRVQPGLFRRVCAQAEKVAGQPFYLVIDEFNRGDAARIFGELLTLIEIDKRGRAPVELPHSGEPFVVPRNVFLIATMNTADRSIALLDAALRRRFGFHELLPEPALLEGSYAGNVHLAPLLRALNARIRKHLKRDARNLQVGHSYLQRDGSALRDFADLRRALRHEVLPLLQEYCYDEPEALRAIVGDRLMDTDTLEIRAELFAGGENDEDLRTALAEWDPSIVAPPDETNAEEPDETIANGEVKGVAGG